MNIPDPVEYGKRFAFPKDYTPGELILGNVVLTQKMHSGISNRLMARKIRHAPDEKTLHRILREDRRERQHELEYRAQLAEQYKIPPDRLQSIVDYVYLHTPEF